MVLLCPLWCWCCCYYTTLLLGVLLPCDIATRYAASVLLCYCAHFSAITKVLLCYCVCCYCSTVLLGMLMLGYFADVLLGRLLFAHAAQTKVVILQGSPIEDQAWCYPHAQRCQKYQLPICACWCESTSQHTASLLASAASHFLLAFVCFSSPSRTSCFHCTSWLPKLLVSLLLPRFVLPQIHFLFTPVA